MSELAVYGSTTDDDQSTTLRERLGEIVGRLATEANSRVAKKHRIEQRWIDDLRQYHGQYSESQISKIKAVEGSTVFINQTRPKTNALIARLTDLLFPTDDRNWEIRPTPVPEMDIDMEDRAKTLRDLQDDLDVVEAKGASAAKAGNTAATQKAELEARRLESELTVTKGAHEDLSRRLDLARRKTRLMQAEMDDQLLQSDYAAAARDVIESACKLGTGIMKGPVTGNSTSARWTKRGDSNVYDLEFRTDDLPGFYWVDPWGFFPDPDARTPMESDDFFERYLMTSRQLRKLARRSDIDDDAVRRLLRQKAQGAMPGYLVHLFDVTGQTDMTMRDRFIVWEYNGELEYEDLLTLTEALGRNDILEAYQEDDGSIDPLLELSVRIWFCQDEVLSFSVHPLDTGEPLYSVFQLEPDEANMFGFGVPYIMRNEQSVYNSGWRMMLDNAGISTGPQIAIRQDAVEPQDGKFNITPRKIWFLNRDFPQGANPFMSFNIDGHQVELANIIGMARQEIDEVTAMPAIAQGEQGTGITKTAQGMALLMNAANVIFKRIVKNFDDDFTVPNIRRLYHFNMQFSEKSIIKGDYEVDARGSSVLVVREMQAQNLVMMATTLGQDPEYGGWLKKNEILAEIARALSLPATQIVRTETEYAEQERKRSEPGMELERARAANAEHERMLKELDISARTAQAEADAATRIRIAEMNYDTEMMKLAQAHNMKLDELEALMSAKAAERRASERKLAAEIAMRQETGVSSGGSV